MATNRLVVAPLSRAAIDNYALTLRRALGYSDNQRVDMLRLIEFVFPQVWDDYDYQVVPDSELRGAEATTSTTEHVIKISESCYKAARHGHARYPFTLAHEAGHLFLHTGKPAQLARGEVKPYMDPEWQADTFASSFLAPTDEVRKCMSLAEISARFGLSGRAAQVRASVLGMKHLTPINTFMKKGR